MEAALQSDYIRGYVRLHKTQPTKLKVDNSQEDQVRDLASIEECSKHFTSGRHGEYWYAYALHQAKCSIP